MCESESKGKGKGKSDGAYIQYMNMLTRSCFGLDETKESPALRLCLLLQPSFVFHFFF